MRKYSRLPPRKRMAFNLALLLALAVLVLQVLWSQPQNSGIESFQPLGLAFHTAVLF